MGTAYSKRRGLGWLCLLWATVLASPVDLLAEHLPLRGYTISDGLAHDQITRIRQDSRGFLWFCTVDGLSRFDGYRFTNYGTHEGLSLARINDLLETRAGVYWIATNGRGIDRFNPERGRQSGGAGDLPLFTAFKVGDEPTSNRVNVLFEDHVGIIWAGTDAGLYRLETKDGHEIFQPVPLNLNKPDRLLGVADLIEDAEGSLWIATNFGVIRRFADGRTHHYAIQPVESDDYVWSLEHDNAGRIWIGARAGLIVFKPDTAARSLGDSSIESSLTRSAHSVSRSSREIALPSNAGQWIWYLPENGLIDVEVRAVFQSRDGIVWIGTRGGNLVQFDGSHFSSSSLTQGSTNSIATLSEDHDGHIWAGTLASGAIKVTRHGLTSFAESDGLGSADVSSIFENREGELCVTAGKWFINRFDGGKFTAIQPNLPAPVIAADPGGRIIQDHAGEWWVATTKGLYLFPKIKQLTELARTPPKAIYTTSEGLADNNVSRLFEDARSDIWLSTYNPPVTLTRWERATNTLRRFSESDGLPPLNWANAFASDKAGNLWLGMHNGGLVRYRNGRFELFETSDGVPEGIIHGLYLDRIGQLWVASSSGGAGRIEEPSSERPRIVTYTTASGLSSNNVKAFTEDQWGRLYVGTTRGVDQLDTTTGAVSHLTVDDGLIKSEIRAAFRDRNNILWFGTHGGLSRFQPQQNAPHVRPPILISGLRVSGVPQPISELGSSEISGLLLTAAQNQIEIDYLSLNFSSPGLLRYQYRLEGVDQSWSVPTDQRTVNYAHLEPGSYRFLVRAWGAENIPSSQPASVTFTIRPPVWRRWWFLALASLLAGAVGYLVLRTPVARRKERRRAADLLRQVREERLSEIQRVRTRIATDLHDDIGSSLTQIVLLSELVQQQIGVGESPLTEPLAQISSVSYELVETMSDIVWAINPQKDHLSDLSQRMRRFASDMLTARGIALRFQAPATDHDVPLGANLRREIFLIFKESINNVLKHSSCTEVRVDFHLDSERLRLQVKDNGSGFDASHDSAGNGAAGNGLPSMRRRTQDLGGSFVLQSDQRSGTSVNLDIPLSRQQVEKYETTIGASPPVE